MQCPNTRRGMGLRRRCPRASLSYDMTELRSHVRAVTSPQIQVSFDSVTGATLRLGTTDIALFARVYDDAGGSSMDGAGFNDNDNRKHNH